MKENTIKARRGILLSLVMSFVIISCYAQSGIRTKVICIGASITEGARIKDPRTDSYPGQLQTLLGTDYLVENYGVGGTTMLSKGNQPYIKTTAYQQALRSNPDVVFIDLGGNDAKAINRPYYNDLVKDTRQLIRTFKEMASNPRIIVLLPTAFFVTDTNGIYDPVCRKEIVPRLQQAAYEEDVEVIDMHPLLINRPELIPDLIHPEEKGSAILAERLYRQLVLPLDTSFDLFGKLTDAGINYTVNSFAGYACADFEMRGRECKVVKPKRTQTGHPWIWRARFWGHEPQTDIALLERGYHLVYYDQSGLVGNPECVANWDTFYTLLNNSGLAQKVVLEGMSRGAMYALNWAASNPQKVAAVYIDNPLLDSRYFAGREEGELTRDLIKAYNLANKQAIATFEGSPTDKVKEIVSGGYPILILCADKDEAVPFETIQEFEQKMKREGGHLTIIIKEGFRHHPHSFPNPKPIVDFIEEAVSKKKIIANPLNLNYRFQVDTPSRREAADPVLEYFNGKYYLFASKSGGYWSSPDLSDWTYIPCKTITTIEEYAPTILVHNNALYYLGSGGKPQIFKTSNPDTDRWESVETKFVYGMTDPAFYKDDDGKMYMYWGCSDVDPIMGVQIDPDDGFKAIGEPVVLIEHNIEKYGWEVPGINNEEKRIGWNEGPCMIKYKDKYYLQYAAPGTQYRIYGDGIYISDSPLGPYTYVESSPFSFKPGGFIGGAGHGHTFKDKYGNYWHIATMKISERHMFERRLGLFPAYMSVKDDNMYTHTVFTDYPFYIPDRKTDFENKDYSMEWNLLSYGKRATSSSSLTGYETSKANDEQVETWWAAQTGKPGEWWAVDLGKQMEVNAIQVNFADQDFTLMAADTYIYQYKIEASDNGTSWKTIVDRTANDKDRAHELIIPDAPLQTRHIRITNTKEIPGKFSLYDIRVFGQGKGTLPSKVTGLEANRDKSDKRIYRLKWNKAGGASGYILRWGVNEEQLNNAAMVYGTEFEGRFFNRDTDYYFSIDAFNENGLTSSR